jgi:hypothetical protein
VPDKYQDARDFITVAEQPREADLALLRELGELLYGGGGEELLKHLNNARAGRRLDVCIDRPAVIRRQPNHRSAQAAYTPRSAPPGTQ